MLQYSRLVPDDVDEFESALIDTVDHVRAHISSCVDPDDSEDEFYSDVQISYSRDGAGTLVTGSLDAEIADYALDAIPVESIDDEVWE